jgi:hypothetical protein
MTYITHITLNTGHTSRIQAGDVSCETLARVRPWLSALIECAQLMPLPLSDLSGYTAHATAQEGALVLTVNGPPVTSGTHMLGMPPPLVTIGVAKKSRHAHLWQLLTAGGYMPAAAPGIRAPQTPWCAVAVWPSAQMHPGAFEWLGDFERCVAWAWAGPK